MTDFNLILTNAKRDDDYVNATELAKQFPDKDVFEWLRSKRTKNISQAIENGGYLVDTGNKAVVKVRVGRTWATYICPQLTIALAEWLSPEFHHHVLSIFERYMRSDITLADEILQRQTDPKAVHWLKERTEGKLVRLEFSEEVENRAKGKFAHAQATNAIYEPLLGGTAKELKQQKGTSNLRDGLTSIELTAIRLAELCATERMRNQDAQGLTKVKECASSAASDVRKVLDNN